MSEQDKIDEALRGLGWTETDLQDDTFVWTHPERVGSLLNTPDSEGATFVRDFAGTRRDWTETTIKATLRRLAKEG